MSPREAAVAALAGLLSTLPELPELPELPAEPGEPAEPAEPGEPVRHARSVASPSAGTLPADQWLREFFRRHPGLGKRDRMQVGDRVFAVLRNLRLYAELARIRRDSAGLAGSRQVGGGAECSGPDTAISVRTPDPPAPDALARDLIAIATELAAGPSTGGPLPAAAGDAGSIIFLHPEAAKALAAGLSEPLRYSLPDWLWARLQAAHGARAGPIALALLQPSPIEVRANLLVGKAQALRLKFAERGVESVGIDGVPAGLRVTGHPNLEALDLFAQGWFEIQDAGSQRIADACDARRGQLVIDFCAGSGGKALAIAARMRNVGKVVAFDTSEERLSRLMPRAKRAGADIVAPVRILGVADPRLGRYRRRADVVLVDAPCSGTGTLRRSPDLKWRLSQARLLQHVREQQAILAAASMLVKPGGKLVYATCSLLEEENLQQVQNFKAAGFRLIDNASWLPDEVPSGGFFIARWQSEARKLPTTGRIWVSHKSLFDGASS